MGGNDFRAYLAFLRDLSSTLMELTRVEREKADAVRADDLDALNEYMKMEQALTMTLRAYDQKREAMLLVLDLQDVPLRGLVAHAPEDCREEAKGTVEELCRQYALFRGAFEVTRDTLECNLHQIEQMLLSVSPEGKGGYPGMEPQIPPALGTDFRA